MKRIRGVVLSFSLVFLFTVCLPQFDQQLLAQSTYGLITGAVTDPSGAAIADAQVALTNLGTAEKRTQSTGADGLYSFPNLFPGRYKIEVEKTGFKRFTRPEVVVEINQSARIDVTLQVGEVTQTVEVSGETPLIQSETSSLGQVVEARKTNELPLNGRNIFNLTTVAPSVVPQGNSYGTPVGKNPFDFANFQVGGSFANQSAEYLDGQPLNIGYINLPLILPTQDSISEFKVQYNNLGPDWGKFSGGVINLSTKSGTNQWHGSAYEFLRNKVLNANEFFANKAGIKRPPFTQNQFGATLGGAAIKDKLFGFLRLWVYGTGWHLRRQGCFGQFYSSDLRSTYSEYQHRDSPAVCRQRHPCKSYQSDFQVFAGFDSESNQQRDSQQLRKGNRPGRG